LNRVPAGVEGECELKICRNPHVRARGRGSTTLRLEDVELGDQLGRVEAIEQVADVVEVDSSCSSALNRARCGMRHVVDGLAAPAPTTVGAGAV
jgi:hypothetical protein